MQPYKVKFNGECYWVISTQAIPSVKALCTMDQCDDNGEPINDEPGYALVMDGEIYRFGKLIGKESDLEKINPSPE